MVEVANKYFYHTKDFIKSGSFGSVFKGFYKESPQTPVAIKCISKDRDSVIGQLVTEVDILNNVKHLNVVEFLKPDEDHDYVYLVMEYCNGGDLERYIKMQTTQRLSEKTMRLFLPQIRDGFQALFDKKIMHRDLKPGNILLSLPEGVDLGTCDVSQIVLKIADFGISRFLNTLTRKQTLTQKQGTLGYMAPEVASGHYDWSADIYSIGVVAFECLTGRIPDVGVDITETLSSQNVSEALCSLIAHMVKVEVPERLSVRDFLNHSFWSSVGHEPVAAVAHMMPKPTVESLFPREQASTSLESRSEVVKWLYFLSLPKEYEPKADPLELDTKQLIDKFGWGSLNFFYLSLVLQELGAHEVAYAAHLEAFKLNPEHHPSFFKLCVELNKVDDFIEYATDIVTQVEAEEDQSTDDADDGESVSDELLAQLKSYLAHARTVKASQAKHGGDATGAAANFGLAASTYKEAKEIHPLQEDAFFLQFLASIAEQGQEASEEEKDLEASLGDLAKLMNTLKTRVKCQSDVACPNCGFVQKDDKQKDNE